MDYDDHEVVSKHGAYEVRRNAELYGHARGFTVWGPDNNGRHCRMASLSSLGAAVMLAQAQQNGDAFRARAAALIAAGVPYHTAIRQADRIETPPEE